MGSQCRRIHIRLSPPKDLSRRAILVAKLETERGIVGAWFEDGDPARLIVDYEPEHFSEATLLDTLAEHGFAGEVTGR